MPGRSAGHFRSVLSLGAVAAGVLRVPSPGPNSIYLLAARTAQAPGTHVRKGER